MPLSLRIVCGCRSAACGVAFAAVAGKAEVQLSIQDGSKWSPAHPFTRLVYSSTTLFDIFVIRLNGDSGPTNERELVE
jgi:hypothetical protein